MNNYDIQVAQAKKHFLTYDQQELINRCCLKYDENYFYITFLGSPYRICRASGNMERKQADTWVSGDSFGEVMTILDWLCDSRAARYPTGRFINVVSQGHYFHSNLQEDGENPLAAFFDKNPKAFHYACRALGGQKHISADHSYTIELLDSLKILVQLWHGDEEFPPRLRFLWDENALRYIRYETTWYALGLIEKRLRQSADERGQEL